MLFKIICYLRMLPNIDLLCRIIYINLIIKFVVVATNEWNLLLEYSIGDASYIPFGSVQIKSMFNERSVQFIPTSNEKMESLKNALIGSAGKEDKRDYRIRSGQAFSTNSVENFIHSKFAHLIELTVDLDQQQLLSITHFSVNQGMNVSNLQIGGGSQSPIQIYIRIKGMDNLPVPDTASYLHRLEEEKRARQHGATQDNRSFLQKYWMYFIPVVLFLILSNAFNPEQGAE